MRVFEYKAQNAKGEVVSDMIQANTRQQAIATLKANGLTPLSVKRPESFAGRAVFSRGISVSEKSAFCRFMATMIRSGMSIPEAVDIIRAETENARLKKILGDIAFQTRKGKSLSVVLSQYESDFGLVFLTMVRVGEQSGTLEKSFDYLARQLAQSHELNQKVKGSMMYPAVIVVAIVANGLLMMLFVLPKISEVFLKLDVPLPFYTKILLQVGNFFGDNALLVLGSTVFLGIFIFMSFQIQTTRKAIVGMITRVPVIRKIVEEVDIARFASTLSTLLRSGVPIIEALDVSSQTLSLPAAKAEAENFSEKVAKGESLSEVLLSTKKIFPPVMVQTIKAGEQSGSLDQVLSEMADFYEKEVDYSLKRFTALLEPALMLLIGAVVGVMVLMMIAPIYGIIGGLQSSIQR